MKKTKFKRTKWHKHQKPLDDFIKDDLVYEDDDGRMVRFKKEVKD